MTRDGEPLKWAGGGRPYNAYAYERPSEVADTLDDKAGLATWHCAKTAFGIAKNRGLYEQFQSLCSEFEDPWNASRATKREVKELIESAKMIGGSERQSGRGTGFHRMAHLVDENRDIPFISPQIEPHLEAYAEAMSRFKVIGYERFIVADDLNDPEGPMDLRIAGSADKIMVDTHTGEILVGDLKTGMHDANYAMKVTVQVAILANGVYYNQQTGEREEIGCLKTRGVLIHVPLEAEKPQCNIYPLDLEAGLRLAQRSNEIKVARKMKLLMRDRLLPS